MKFLFSLHSSFAINPARFIYLEDGDFAKTEVEESDLIENLDLEELIAEIKLRSKWKRKSEKEKIFKEVLEAKLTGIYRKAFIRKDEKRYGDPENEYELDERVAHNVRRTMVLFADEKKSKFLKFGDKFKEVIESINYEIEVINTPPASDKEKESQLWQIFAKPESEDLENQELKSLNPEIQAWLKKNKYNFRFQYVKEDNNGNPQLVKKDTPDATLSLVFFHAGKPVTRIKSNMILSMDPIYQNGKVVGIRTLDGDYDAAIRTEDGVEHAKKSKVEDKIEAIFTVKNELVTNPKTIARNKKGENIFIPGEVIKKSNKEINAAINKVMEETKGRIAKVVGNITSLRLGVSVEKVAQDTAREVDPEIDVVEGTESPKAPTLNDGWDNLIAEDQKNFLSPKTIKKLNEISDCSEHISDIHFDNNGELETLNMPYTGDNNILKKAIQLLPKKTKELLEKDSESLSFIFKNGHIVRYFTNATNIAFLNEEKENLESLFTPNVPSIKFSDFHSLEEVIAKLPNEKFFKYELRNNLVTIAGTEYDRVEKGVLMPVKDDTVSSSPNNASKALEKSEKEAAEKDKEIKQPTIAEAVFQEKVAAEDEADDSSASAQEGTTDSSESNSDKEAPSLSEENKSSLYTEKAGSLVRGILRNATPEDIEKFASNSVTVVSSNGASETTKDKEISEESLYAALGKTKEELDQIIEEKKSSETFLYDLYAKLQKGNIDWKVIAKNLAEKGIKTSCENHQVGRKDSLSLFLLKNNFDNPELKEKNLAIEKNNAYESMIERANRLDPSDEDENEE